MTMSTLNAAAQNADAAIAYEKAKLDQIIREEQAAQRDLDANHEQQQQLRHTEQQISNYLANKGRDRTAQEKKIADAEEALRDQAEAVLKTMANFGLESPPQPAPAQPTVPDDLGVGEVPPTEREALYAQQAGEQGAPSTMTQPTPIASGPTGTMVAPHPELLGDPSRSQDLPREAVEAVSTESSSGAHRTVRTGGQPTEKATGRGRRG